MKTKKLIPLIVIFSLFTTFVVAEDITAELDAIKMGINTVWVLIAAFLVFFMQAGFGMVEAGFIRAKNTANILMKNLLDFSIASIAYFVVGFGIMFGVGNLIFGKTGFLLQNLPSEMFGIPSLAFWIFQVVFAGAAATIVAGALAERLKFKAYIVYSFIISAIIYPL